MIAIERGDVDVVAAVIVVIADGHAHAVDFDIEAAARGDVGEGAVAVVAVERGGGAAAARREVLAVDEQDIRPAVAIGIEESDAGAQRFRQVLLAGAAGVVREVDASLRGDVSEDDGRTIRRRGRSHDAGRGQGEKAQSGGKEKGAFHG